MLSQVVMSASDTPAFLLFLAVLNASLFALGACATAVVFLVLRRPYRWVYFTLAKLGIIGIVGTILIIVVPQRLVPPSGRAYVYLGSVMLIAIGMTGVATTIVRKAGRDRLRYVFDRPEEEATFVERLRGIETREVITEDRIDKEVERNDAFEKRADDHGESRDNEHDHP